MSYTGLYSGTSPMMWTQAIGPSDDAVFSSFAALYDEMKCEGATLVVYTGLAYQTATVRPPIVTAFDHNVPSISGIGGVWDYDNAKLIDWQKQSTHRTVVKKTYFFDSKTSENMLSWQPTSQASSLKIGTFVAASSSSFGASSTFLLFVKLHTRFRNRKSN